MDKFRAIEYFVAAAESGSFAAAARQLGVSVPAVQKLVGALERTLGLALFERHTQGVRLTAEGSDYLDHCRPWLDELASTEAVLRRGVERATGVLTLATNEQLVRHVLLPVLARFRARFPDIRFDLRTVHRLTDADAQAAEVLLVHSWFDAAPDYVQRRLETSRMLIVATAEYWASRGLPARPEDLARHDCLMMRNPAGIVIDLWEFTRGAERVEVPVDGWLATNSREALLEAVMRGQGVGRVSESTTRPEVLGGRLVPALVDWTVEGGPPLNLLYRPSARRRPAARHFIDFLLQWLQQHEAEGQFPAMHPSSDLPTWYRRGLGRATASRRAPR